MKIQGPNRGPKEAKMRRSRNKRTRRNRASHGLAVWSSTGHGAEMHSRPPTRTAVRAYGCAAVRVLPSLFDF